MEIKFKNKEVLPKLAQVVSVVSSKNTIPILSCVLVDIDNYTISLLASNMDVTLRMQSRLDYSDVDKFTMCVESSDFIKALRNLGDVDVSMKIDTERHNIVLDYGKGHFNLPFQESNDFPKPQYNLSGAKEHTMKCDALIRLIARVDFAIANDELRPVMNGIHFDFTDKGVIAAASDGAKLSTCRDDSLLVDTSEEGFNMPEKVSATLKNILPSCGQTDVKIVFTQNAAIFTNDEFMLQSTLIEGKYPNFQKVIPQEFACAAYIPKEELIMALNRVMPMGNSASELVVCKFTQGELTISTEDVDYSKSASETLLIQYFGDDMTIGFKGSSLIQIAKNVDFDNIAIDMNTPQKACVIYGKSKDEHLSLLMPMRIM